jgi:hypothetical protein
MLADPDGNWITLVETGPAFPTDRSIRTVSAIGTPLSHSVKGRPRRRCTLLSL